MAIGPKRFEDMTPDEKKNAFNAWFRSKKTRQLRAQQRRQAVRQAWLLAGRPQKPEDVPGYDGVLDVLRGRWSLKDLPPPSLRALFS